MTMLQDVKDHLRVTHSDDDALLQRLIDSAIVEYLRFVNETVSIGGIVELSEDATSGVILMVQSGYEGDPLERDKMRRCAESLWMPYRNELGV